MRDAARQIDDDPVMRSLCPLAFLAACQFSSPTAKVDAERSDGGGGGEWVQVDELSIPVNSVTARVTSTFVLQANVGYRLRASGTFFTTSLGRLGDAEYYNFNVGPPVDEAAGIDVGLAVNDPIVDGTRTPRWGAYSAEHVYEVPWMGAGAPIIVQLHDGNYADNVGALKLEILALR